MSLDKDTIKRKLLNFGLEPDEAKVYLYLLADTPKSVLDISRALGLGRNIVYRQIERLEEKQLLVRVSSSSGVKVGAASYHNLERLLEAEQRRLEELKSSSHALFGSLAEIAAQGESGIIRYYRGVEGLTEITSRSLQARGEICIFELDSMTSYITFDEAEKIRQGFVERRTLIKQLCNAKEIPSWTDNQELVRHFWQCRYVNPDKLRVDFEFLIYNDTFSMYTFKDSELWGLEVISPAIANMQRQLFSYVWNSASKMRLLNNRGHARVNKVGE